MLFIELLIDLKNTIIYFDDNFSLKFGILLFCRIQWQSKIDKGMVNLFNLNWKVYIVQHIFKNV